MEIVKEEKLGVYAANFVEACYSCLSRQYFAKALNGWIQSDNQLFVSGFFFAGVGGSSVRCVDEMKERLDRNCQKNNSSLYVYTVAEFHMC